MNNSINRGKSSLSSRFVKAEVVFGSPGRGCAGSGVCRLIPFQKMKKWNRTCSKFEIIINWYDDGNLDFVLNINKLKKDEKFTWFSGPNFILEEDFYFPLWFQHELNQKKIYIPVGKYPYSIKDNELKIFFPWKNEINNKSRVIARPILLQAQ